MRPLRSFFLLTILASGLTACGPQSSTSPDDTNAPALPPPASLRVDLGFFQQQPGALDQATNARLHWTNAVVRVLLINAFVDAAFTPPFSAFELALHSLPVAQEDGSFLWSYVWNDGDREVRIDLLGRPVGQNVEWEVRITDTAATPPLDHALWFHGQSSSSNHSGFWIFLEPGGLQAGRNVARIDWNVDGDHQAELVITNLDARDEGVDDTLTYAIEEDRASVVYEDVSEPAAMRIVWDTVTGAGSLFTPDYNEGERACWDEHQQDAACGPDFPAAL